MYITCVNNLYILSYAFRDCSPSTSIHFKIEDPENIVVSNSAFDKKSYESFTLYIPSGSRWGYRHHPVLGKFKNIEIE